MEKINFQNAPFSYRSMIPESQEEVTIPWARHLVYNFVNGYGLVGTCTLHPGGKTAINLNLTKYFKFPPHIYFYVQTDDGLDELLRGFFTSSKENPSSLKDIFKQSGWSYMIAGDNVILMDWDEPTKGWSWIMPTTQMTIYFRVH